jgi:hypothetical protein
MRAAWLVPLIHIILNNPLVYPQGTRYSFWLVLIVILGAFMVQRAVQDMPGARIRTMVAGLTVAVCVAAFLYRDPDGRSLASLEQFGQSMGDWMVGIPPSVLVVITTTLLWAHGLMSDWGGLDDLWRGFVVGVVVLVGLLLIPAHWMQGISMSTAVQSFLLWGLLALALRSVADALSLEKTRRGMAPALNHYWLAMVGAAVLVILFGAWLLANTIAPQILSGLLTVLVGIIRYLAQLFIYVAAGLFYLFYRLFGSLFDLDPEEIPQPSDEGPMMPNIAEQFREFDVPSAGLTISGDYWRYLLFGLLAAALVLVLYLAWRRRRTPRSGQVVEHREFIGSRDLFWQQLSSLWRRRPRPVAPTPYVDLGDGQDSRRAIRRLYQRLLQRAHALGRPRLPGQTPGAYRRALAGLVPDDQGALDTLTDAYIQARYAPDDPPAQVVADADEAFARLGRALDGRGGE